MKKDHPLMDSLVEGNLNIIIIVFIQTIKSYQMFHECQTLYQLLCVRQQTMFNKTNVKASISIISTECFGISDLLCNYQAT
jgi:type II secretory pathway component PulC